MSFAWPSGEPDLWKDDRAWKAELAREWDLGYALVDNSRAWFGTRLGRQGIAELVRHSLLRVLQAEVPPRLEQWKLLNEEFFSQRPDVTLRVYHSAFDLAFLDHMPNVRRFSADCMLTAQNVQAVASLPDLETLSIGIYDLTSFEFLNHVNDRLIQLGIFDTSSSKPSISTVARFNDLRFLSLHGQQKGIEAVSELRNLEKLTLGSISTPGLDFLVGLNNLWSLSIVLGGIRNLAALQTLPHLKFLELALVRGLSDLTPVSETTGLQCLNLEQVRQVTNLPDLSCLDSLRRLAVIDMKGVHDLTPIRLAPKLEDILFTPGRSFAPSELRWILELPNLKTAAFGFSTMKRKLAFDAVAATRGLSTRLTEFAFV